MKSSEIHNAIDDFIKLKRDIRSNPFMATRIMAMIEDKKNEKITKSLFKNKM